MRSRKPKVCFDFVIPAERRSRRIAAREKAIDEEGGSGVVSGGKCYRNVVIV